MGMVSICVYIGIINIVPITKGIILGYVIYKPQPEHQPHGDITAMSVVLP